MNEIDKLIVRKFNVQKRFVEVDDASFILSLRIDEKLSKYLSFTEKDLPRQVEWIKKYKLNERDKKEFYFIFNELTSQKRFGVSRIYNVEPDSFEIGSWLFSKESPEGLSILADLATRDYAFSNPNFAYCRFEVRKDNKSVVNYHRRFDPILVRENDLNYYFKLSKEKYMLFRNKILQLYTHGIK
jgi:RimJ/RimL family protein N-acetyltransferase